METELGAFPEPDTSSIETVLLLDVLLGQCVRDCVCFGGDVCVLMCLVKRAFRWYKAASDLFPYLCRSWQTKASSSGRREKGPLVSETSAKKAGAGGGPHH